MHWRCLYWPGVSRCHLQAADVPAACAQGPENLLTNRIWRTPACPDRWDRWWVRQTGKQTGKQVKNPLPVCECLQVPAVAAGQPQRPVSEDVRTLGHRQVEQAAPCWPEQGLQPHLHTAPERQKAVRQLDYNSHNAHRGQVTSVTRLIILSDVYMLTYLILLWPIRQLLHSWWK